MRIRKPNNVINFNGKDIKVNNILTSNMKLAVDIEAGYEVLGIQMAPHSIAGYNVCQFASLECIKACIFTSGRGRFNNVQLARIARKKLFFTNKKAFKDQLFYEIARAIKKNEKNGKKTAIRLNVFSDIPWEKVLPELFTFFPNVKFYDYTKNYNRVKAGYILPNNYHLTFSRSENTSLQLINEILANNVNIAIPFACKKNELPKQWNNIEVINGDKSDIRFLDSIGVIVGLSVKGDRKKLTQGGFVQACNSQAIEVNSNRFLLSLV